MKRKVMRRSSCPNCGHPHTTHPLAINQQGCSRHCRRREIRVRVLRQHKHDPRGSRVRGVYYFVDTPDQRDRRRR